MIGSSSACRCYGVERVKLSSHEVLYIYRMQMCTPIHVSGSCRLLHRDADSKLNEFNAELAEVMFGVASFPYTGADPGFYKGGEGGSRASRCNLYRATTLIESNFCVESLWVAKF